VRATVAVPCPDEHVELALELEGGPYAPGRAQSFVVTYETASGTGELEIPFQARLCPAEVADFHCVPT